MNSEQKKPTICSSLEVTLNVLVDFDGVRISITCHILHLSLSRFVNSWAKYDFSAMFLTLLSLFA